MTTNPFAELDKVQTSINLNEAYDREIRAIQERRTMIWSWKNELTKIKKNRDKKKFRGRHDS